MLGRVTVWAKVSLFGWRERCKRVNRVGRARGTRQRDKSGTSRSRRNPRFRAGFDPNHCLGTGARSSRTALAYFSSYSPSECTRCPCSGIHPSRVDQPIAASESTTWSPVLGMPRRVIADAELTGEDPPIRGDDREVDRCFKLREPFQERIPSEIVDLVGSYVMRA